VSTYILGGTGEIALREIYRAFQTAKRYRCTLPSHYHDRLAYEEERESIANRQNITANTAAAALRFLILFERERAISSERISVVPFAIVGKSLCKWRYVSLHFSQVFMRHIVAKNSRQEQRKAGEQRLREEQRHQCAKGRYKE